jgi:hypothetical protein
MLRVVEPLNSNRDLAVGRTVFGIGLNQEYWTTALSKWRYCKMKNFVKTLSILPTLALLLAVFGAVALGILGCDNGSTSKSGILDNYILIPSNTEMAKIGNDAAYPLSGKYLLTANITLSSWTPIGTDVAPFTGEFNGAGKTITLQSFNSTAVSATTYLGIFGYTKGTSSTSKAEIKSLTVNSTVNQTSTATVSQAIGLVTGYAENADIKNITLGGSFQFVAPTTAYVGGIAGIISTAALVKDSTGNLDMTINPGTGGTSMLTGTLAYSYVGGFAGGFHLGAGISNCHNTGNVTAVNLPSPAASAQIFVGGITGGSAYAFDTSFKGYIEDCSSTGNITGQARGSWTFAGGIAGTIVGGTTADVNLTTRIVRSFATGTVSVAGTSSGFPYIGGIVGYNYYGALVSQCYFNGTVIADKANDYTGGIAGYNSQQTAPNNSRIEDCWSAGTVRGFRNAGGIVGQNQVNTYIRRCYSIATVEATDTGATGVGGIAGMNASTQTDAITGNAALNPVIRITGGGSTANIHRMVGAGTNTTGLTNNIGYSGVTISGGSYAADAAKDGADCVEKPASSVFAGMGWDFTNVWKMGANGYPALQWQD